MLKKRQNSISILLIPGEYTYCHWIAQWMVKMVSLCVCFITIKKSWGNHSYLQGHIKTGSWLDVAPGPKFANLCSMLLWVSWWFLQMSHYDCYYWVLVNAYLTSTICLPNSLLTIVPRISFPPSRYSFLCTEVHPLVILVLMALRSKLRFFFFP